MFKNYFNTWKEGFSYLLSDDLISFYSFFTIIFAECIYLKVFCSNSSVAIPLIIVLLSYIVNIIVSSWLIGNYEFTDKVKKYSIIYLIVFVLLFIIGCFINIKLNVIITIIPLAFTKLATIIRDFQDIEYIVLPDLITINLLIISEIIVVVIPFFTLILSIVNIPMLPIWLKVTLPLLYFVFMPFISYLEDVLASKNIFELFPKIL